jgi:hypothetical protein
MKEFEGFFGNLSLSVLGATSRFANLKGRANLTPSEPLRLKTSLCDLDILLQRAGGWGWPFSLPARYRNGQVSPKEQDPAKNWRGHRRGQVPENGVRTSQSVHAVMQKSVIV